MDLNGEFMFSICSFDLIWGKRYEMDAPYYMAHMTDEYNTTATP